MLQLECINNTLEILDIQNNAPHTRFHFISLTTDFSHENMASWNTKIHIGKVVFINMHKIHIVLLIIVYHRRHFMTLPCLGSWEIPQSKTKYNEFPLCGYEVEVEMQLRLWCICVIPPKSYKTNMFWMIRACKWIPKISLS